MRLEFKFEILFKMYERFFSTKMMAISNCQLQCWISIADIWCLTYTYERRLTHFLWFFRLILSNLREKKLSFKILIHFNLFSRSLPKLTAHEDEGVHQNPQYTGQHHFHPVVHDHDFCERVVINVSPSVFFYFRNT